MEQDDVNNDWQVKKKLVTRCYYLYIGKFRNVVLETKAAGLQKNFLNAHKKEEKYLLGF